MEKVKMVITINGREEFVELIKTLFDMGYSWGNLSGENRYNPYYIPFGMPDDYRIGVVLGYFSDNQLGITSNSNPIFLTEDGYELVKFKEFMKNENKELEPEEISILELMS